MAGSQPASPTLSLAVYTSPSSCLNSRKTGCSLDVLCLLDCVPAVTYLDDVLYLSITRSKPKHHC